MIEVINMHQCRDFGKVPGDCRCDRETKWGNPFIMYETNMRDKVCDLYEDYFDTITTMGEVDTVKILLRLGGLTPIQVDKWMFVTGGYLDIRDLKDAKRLGCWCFGAGTLITTKRGFIPIEEVTTDDMVLSHDSQYHRVIKTMVFKNVPTVKVKFQGTPEPMICTENHEFYACKRVRLQRDNFRKVVSMPREWISAKNLKKDIKTSHSCGTLVGFPRDVITNFDDDHSKEFWYIVGRYLGDGWIIDYDKKSSYLKLDGTQSNKKTWQVGICDAFEKADYLELKIKESGLKACKTKMKTEITFRICNKEFTLFIMNNFGRYSNGKYIPEWCFSLPIEKQRSLLQGCIDSDGSVDHKRKTISICTVSKLLAYGIARLSRNINNTKVSMCKKSIKRDSIIDGRNIKNNYPPYVVSWMIDSNKGLSNDNCVWMPFRNINRGEYVDVYNLSVEDSESFVANGVAVHNCTPQRCHCLYLKKKIEDLTQERFE